MVLRPSESAVVELTSSDGVRLPVHRLGERSGPAVLVCHATGFHGRAYGPTVAAFRRLDAYAPDLRGHGDASPPLGSRYHWKGFADDVLAVAEWLDCPLVGFGHSMGGASLLMAELRRPGTFRALFCWEPIVYPARFSSAENSPLVAASQRRRNRFDSWQAAIENFSSKPPFDRFHPDALRAYVEHGFASRPEGGVELKLPGEQEAEVYRMSVRHDTFEQLGRVTCPVTVACGSRDGGTSSAVASEVAAALPRGHYRSWDDLGHLGPLEAPERVGAAVEAALLESLAAVE